MYPYLNGSDLNSNPDQSPSRWVINFQDWPLNEAEKFQEVLKIVEERVKPERLKNKYSKTAKEKWWLFERSRPELYESIGDSETVLVSTRHTKHLMHAFVSSKWIYDVALNVFVKNIDVLSGFIHSTIYEVWVRQYGSSLETRLRYTLTDCFETFPFPQTDSELILRGKAYHNYRHEIMLTRQEGLTATYNRFHDPEEAAPDIVRLRELHVEMDVAVASAYGWEDLALEHGFHETAQGVRFTISESARREVLGRLLVLNHRRWEEEVAAGLHEKGGKGSRGEKRKGRKGEKEEDKQGRLF